MKEALRYIWLLLLWLPLLEGWQSATTSFGCNQRIISISTESARRQTIDGGSLGIRQRHDATLRSTVSLLSSTNSDDKLATPDATTTTTTTTSGGGPVQMAPIFDFRQNDTVSKFERIDDAIMGGISTSAIRQLPTESFARWSGVCRETGGGFCGTRTLPFVEPLMLNPDLADGLYLDCQLTSDNEPERRVWKVSVRTEASRGEELFQCEYSLPKTVEDDSNKWSRIYLPFDKFRKVRGARLVDGNSTSITKMNITNGIYQIGFTMSKFVSAVNMTSMDNFRPGYFELQLQEVGVYSNTSRAAEGTSPLFLSTNVKGNIIKTLSKDESLKRRPLLLKILLPITKIFFSEQASRRRLAMQLLRERWSMGRMRTIWLGLRFRSRNKGGWIASIGTTASILAIDSFRTVVGNLLRFGLFYPLVILRRTLSVLTKPFQAKKAVAKGA